MHSRFRTIGGVMEKATKSLPPGLHPSQPWRAGDSRGSVFTRKLPWGECIDKPGRLTVTARISRSLQTPRNLPLSRKSARSFHQSFASPVNERVTVAGRFFRFVK